MSAPSPVIGSGILKAQDDRKEAVLLGLPGKIDITRTEQRRQQRYFSAAQWDRLVRLKALRDGGAVIKFVASSI